MAYPAAPGCAAFPQIYQWGLLWATTLADLSDDLGVDVMDRLVVGSMAYLGGVAAGVPAFEVAAEALLEADRAYYGGAHLGALVRRLAARGMVDGRRYGPVVEHAPLASTEQTGGTRPIVATIRPTLGPVARAVVRALAEMPSGTQPLGPVEMAREGATDVFRVDLPLPVEAATVRYCCLLYTSPSPRD